MQLPPWGVGSPHTCCLLQLRVYPFWAAGAGCVISPPKTGDSAVRSDSDTGGLLAIMIDYKIIALLKKERDRYLL